MKNIKLYVLAAAMALCGITMAQSDGTTPAAKPSGPAHPYVAPTGKEATTHKAPASRPAHNGPTAVAQPQGKEAGHTKTTTHPAHNGPTPVRTQSDRAVRTNTSK